MRRAPDAVSIAIASPVALITRRSPTSQATPHCHRLAVAQRRGTVVHAVGRGQCFIQVEAAMVDRVRAMRRPGESYRDVAKEPIYVRRPFEGSLPSSAL